MTNRSSLRYPILLLGIYLILQGCWFVVPRVFSILELQLQDNIVRLAYFLDFEAKISPDIIYIDLDDASLDNLPYPPDSPRLYAEIINALAEAGCSLQLIDILLLPSNSAENLLKSIERAGNVYLPVIFSGRALKGDGPNPFLRAIPLAKRRNLPFPLGTSDQPGSDILNTVAAGLGHINSAPDIDGVYRRIPLFYNNGSGLIPTISLRAAVGYFGITPEKLVIENNRVILPDANYPDGRMRDIVIPFDRFGMSRINFTGPWPHVFAHYSAATILEKSKTANGLLRLQDELEGTFAIIADVTTSGRDFGPVPFSPHSPLSQLHAQFLNSIMNNSFIREATVAQNYIIQAIMLFLFIGVSLYYRGVRLLGLVFLLGMILVLVNFGSFVFWRFSFPIVFSLSFLFLGSFVILSLQFVDIQQEKKIMRARLTPYFAPSVMNKILASPEMLSNVTKKRITILFSDIVGFTQWSSTREAAEIHEALSRYFREMSSVVFSFEGTIDKFMGDGMLAFFGDPSPYEDHAQRAVKAALAMQQKVWELKKEWSMTGGMKIRIRIGIHTGEVVVGNMGSMERMDYTVIGSHVNLAQRLESNCEPDRILISKEVKEQLGNDYKTTTSGTIAVKGFSDPIEVYYVSRYQPPQYHVI